MLVDHQHWREDRFGTDRGASMWAANRGNQVKRFGIRLVIDPQDKYQPAWHSSYILSGFCKPDHPSMQPWGRPYSKSRAKVMVHMTEHNNV